MLICGPETTRDAPIEGPQAFPTTSAQRRVWFTEKAFGPSAANNLVLGMRLTGALDLSALEFALFLLVRRHEVFRTTFDDVAGRPVQFVHSEGRPIFRVTDLAQHSEPEQAAYAAARDIAHAPFDLSVGPPLRVGLLCLGPEHHVLICTIHHIITDGWSLGLFAKELVTCYVAFHEGIQPILPNMPLQYADYAEWEREWLESEEFRNQLAAYSVRFVGAPEPPDLTGSGDAEAATGTTGASRALRLPPDLWASVKSAASRQRTTSFALSLAAFHVLLHHVSGRADLVVGVPVARRNRVEFENTLGLFSDIVAVRADLTGDPSVTELVGRTKEALLEALANEDVPFDQLVRELRPARSFGNNPVFQILFASVPAAAALERFGGLATAPYFIEAAAAPFDLAISLIEEPSGAGWLRAEYRTSVFAAVEITDLLDRYLSLLTAVVQRPGARISRLHVPAIPGLLRGEGAPVLPPASTPAEDGGATSTPETTLKEIITDVWKEALRLPDVATNANFFDLGGHSLLAARIAHEIGNVLGRRIPISLLFSEPTIDRLALALRREGPSFPGVIPLSITGTRPPLFLVGSGPSLRRLGRELDPRQPCFLIDMFALHEERLVAGQPLLATLAEIAAEFVREILNIQPDGPYLLAGQCDGGILAVEIALQLQASSREVALLAQLDTPVDGYFWPVLGGRRRGWFRTRAAISLALSGRYGELVEWGQHFFRRISHKLTPTEQWIDPIWAMIWQAVYQYQQSRPFAGEIQLFRAQDRVRIYQDVTRGWETRAERVRVWDVPGAHQDYVDKAATRQQIVDTIERAVIGAGQE